jgi:hypothetical protein
VKSPNTFVPVKHVFLTTPCMMCACKKGVAGAIAFVPDTPSDEINVRTTAGKVAKYLHVTRGGKIVTVAVGGRECEV